jgi:hypothetical protein
MTGRWRTIEEDVINDIPVGSWVHVSRFVLAYLSFLVSTNNILSYDEGLLFATLCLSPVSFEVGMLSVSVEF